MRLHVDALTADELLALAESTAGTDVWVSKFEAHRSNTHRAAFEIQLRGNGKRHTRWPNPGQSGGIDYTGGKAATWDDWGFFLAAVYERDASALAAGWYSSRAEFHAMTKGAYLPAGATA